VDIEPDRLSGRKTTATVIGRVPAKFLIAAFLAVEALLVRYYFRDWIVMGSLALGAVWFVLDAPLVWKDRKYLPKQMRLFLWGWTRPRQSGSSGMLRRARSHISIRERKCSPESGPDERCLRVRIEPGGSRILASSPGKKPPNCLSNSQVAVSGSLKTEESALNFRFQVASDAQHALNEGHKWGR